MKDYTKVLQIEKSEFTLPQGFCIYFYNKKSKSFFSYNGEEFLLDRNYNLPYKKDSQIKIKSKIDCEMMVDLSSLSDYKISLSDRDDTIHSGSKESFFLPLFRAEPVTMFIRNQNSKNNNLRIKFNGEYSDKVIESSNDEIVDRINNMYHENSGIETFNSNNTGIKDAKNKYYTDIDLISKAGELECLSEIGSGSFRNVFEIVDGSKLGINLDSSSDNVIKIAKTKGGVIANKREFQTWNSVKGTELEKYFCPIRNRGPEFKYVIMKMKPNLLIEKSTIKRNEVLNRIEDKLKKNIGIDNIDPPVVDDFDLSFDNIASDENENFVLIDYPYGGKY